MPRGGKRPGQGRPKGSKTDGRSKRALLTKDRNHYATKYRVLPLDFMLSLLQNTKADKEDRKWAAKESAPYLHPRVSSVEVGGPGGGPITVQILKFTPDDEKAPDA